MTKTSKTESDGRAKPPTSVVGPMAVSVVVHALLLVVLLSVALTVEPSGSRSRTVDDAFVISLDEPLPIPEPIQSAAIQSLPVVESSQIEVSLPSATDLVGSSDSTARSSIGRGGGGVASLARGGGTSTPGVSFAGLRTKQAQRVVYVVDGSGSMVTSMPFVVEELLRSVARLGASQRFAVVLFRNRPPQQGGDVASKRYDVFAGSDGTLLLADDRNKQRLRTWAGQLVPRGISNPSDGLARALSFKPDAVFLLARSIRRSGSNAGWGVGVDEIMAELERDNPRSAASQRRPVVIKTIQFIDEDPTGTMQRIGDEHGKAEGESGYTLLTLPDLESIEDHEPIGETLGQDAQIERAADILSDLSATGYDTAALFGIGVGAERIEAAREAAKALHVADQSDATDPLAVLVRARSQMLIAAASDDDDVRLDTTIAELGSLGEAAPDVTKLNLAIARLLRRHKADIEDARRVLSTIDVSSLDPTSVAELLMARVLAEVPGSRAELLAQMAGEPFRTPQGLDGSLCAAAADVLARRAAVQSDIIQVAEALEPWAELIRDGSIEREALLSRAGAAAATVDRDAMPLEVAYAVGRASLQGQIVRPDTLELLDRVAVESRVNWLKFAALRDSALARVAAWEQTNDATLAVVAAERLLEYVQEASGAVDREQMLTLSLGLCERLMVDGESKAITARIEAVYTEATALAIEVLPNEHSRSDSWICAYASRLLQEGVDAQDGSDSRRRALALLEQVGPTSPVAKDAAKLRLYARVQTTEELRARMDLARANRDESALLANSAAILVECERADADAAAVPGDLADWLEANRADALVEQGSSRATPVYNKLVARQANVPGGSARLSLGSARAMLAAGHDAQGFAALRDLAKQLDRSGRDGQPRQSEFWHAWTILVEISADHGRPVQAHIARLSEIDPNLGGEPWRTRLRSANQR